MFRPHLFCGNVYSVHWHLRITKRHSTGSLYPGLRYERNQLQFDRQDHCQRLSLGCRVQHVFASGGLQRRHWYERGHLWSHRGSCHFYHNQPSVLRAWMWMGRFDLLSWGALHPMQPGVRDKRGQLQNARSISWHWLQFRWFWNNQHLHSGDDLRRWVSHEWGPLRSNWRIASRS